MKINPISIKSSQRANIVSDIPIIPTNDLNKLRTKRLEELRKEEKEHKLIKNKKIEELKTKIDAINNQGNKAAISKKNNTMAISVQIDNVSDKKNFTHELTNLVDQ